MSGSETNKKSHPLVAKVICSSAPRIPTCIAACGLPSYSCERALPTYGWDVDVACTKISNRELGTNAAGPRGLYPYLPLRGRAYLVARCHDTAQRQCVLSGPTRSSLCPLA